MIEPTRTHRSTKGILEKLSQAGKSSSAVCFIFAERHELIKQFYRFS